MNKLFIILLALCLVSVHAFVKRDAPEAPKSDFDLENINKQLTELGGKISDQFKQTFNQENFDKFVDSAKKTFEGFGKNSEAKKE